MRGFAVLVLTRCTVQRRHLSLVLLPLPMQLGSVLHIAAPPPRVLSVTFDYSESLSHRSLSTHAVFWCSIPVRLGAHWKLRSLNYRIFSNLIRTLFTVSEG